MDSFSAVVELNLRTIADIDAADWRTFLRFQNQWAATTVVLVCALYRSCTRPMRKSAVGPNCSSIPARSSIAALSGILLPPATRIS